MTKEELKRTLEEKADAYARTLEEGGVEAGGTLATLAALAYKQGFLDGMNNGLDAVHSALPGGAR